MKIAWSIFVAAGLCLWMSMSVVNARSTSLSQIGNNALIQKDFQASVQDCGGSKPVFCAAKVATCGAKCYKSGISSLSCIACLGISYHKCKDCLAVAYQTCKVCVGWAYDKCKDCLTGFFEENVKDAVVSVKCIENNNWSKDLTLAKLNAIIKTVIGTMYGSVYIFAPFCPKTNDRGHVYVSGKKGHAEDLMLDNCGRTNTFFLTSAPCPDCAVKLKNEYANQNKPTILIARPYQGKGKCENGNKRINTACLAMLAKDGFTLQPWNWQSLNGLLTNTDCRNSITLNTKALSARNEKVVNYLNQVNNMLRYNTQDFETECKNALNVC